MDCAAHSQTAAQQEHGADGAQKRSYVRQRGMLVKSAATHIQHMQKALQQMNLRLDNVVTDITGQTGMRFIKAILAGERDAQFGEERDGVPRARRASL